MRKNLKFSQRSRRAAATLAGACVSIALANTARATAALWTTYDDFSQWESVSSSFTVAGDTTYDSDGSAINGFGNTTSPSLAGTPGSMQINQTVYPDTFDTPAESPEMTTTPALSILDPGSTEPSGVGSNGSMVEFFGTLKMSYTMPDDEAPPTTGYFALGLVLNYTGTYDQLFYYNLTADGATFSQTTTDGQVTDTVTMPYIISPVNGDLSYCQILVAYNSNFEPLQPFYVDNIGVLPTPLEWNNSGASGDGATWDNLNNQNWSDTLGASFGAFLPAVYSDNSNVTFDDNNSGHYNVTLNTTVSPVSVTFNNNSGNYFLSGTGGIIGTTSLAVTGSASVSISTSNSYTGGTTISAGTLVLNGPHALPTGGIVVNNGTLDVEANTVAGNVSGTGSLIVGSANHATLQLTANSGLSSVGSLAVGSGSSLDITNNALIVNYGTGADPLTTIQSYLTDSYNSGWTAGEILSSSVASLNASQSALIYSVGYADGADGITGVPSGEIEILPTLAGDAKMQGNVVFGDFQLLSQYFGQANTTWDEGNFTYGSTTNFGDFQLLSQNFGQSASALSAGEVASINGFASQFGEEFEANPDGIGYSLVSVPEPASVGLLAVAGISLLARRRSNRRA
jgi:autotransporter-associated beta strand protein